MTALLALIVAARAASVVLSPVQFDRITDTTITANPDGIRARMADQLTGGGFEVASSGAGDYRVEMIVRTAQIRYLSPKAIEVSVEWRVSPRSGGPVMYSVLTRGNAESGTAALNELALEAFGDAAAHLASRERFHDAVAVAPVGGGVAVRSDARLHVRTCTRATMRLPRDIASSFDAVVVVRGGASLGTGVAVSPDGFVITAAHVVPKGVPIQVTTRAGKSLPAEVIRRDTAQDIAIVHVEGLSANCLPLEAIVPEIGTDLFVIGTPAGLDYSVSKGVVSGIRALEAHRFLQTDASISPGNSGGPMLGENGSVIGIVSWKIRAAGFEGLGFGVPGPAVIDSLGLAYAERSDTAWASFTDPEPDTAPLDPSLVDIPDVSVFAEAARVRALEDKRSARRVSGFVLIGVGGAVAGATALGAGGADHASDLLWTTLGVGNALGWATALGGATLVGLSFVPVSNEGALQLSVTGHF